MLWMADGSEEEWFEGKSTTKTSSIPVTYQADCIYLTNHLDEFGTIARNVSFMGHLG